MNGHRPLGVGQVQFALYLVAFAMLLGAIYAAHVWWEDHNDALLEQGRSEERLKWEAQRRDDQANYDAEIKKLRDEKDAAVASLQGQLAQADKRFLDKSKEADGERQKNFAFERGLHDGSIVFVDPGVRAPGTSGGSAGAAASGTVADSAGASGCRSGQLSGYAAEFLDSEAARADATVTDLVNRLTLAQDNVRAYYELAKNGCKKPPDAAHPPQ